MTELDPAQDPPTSKEGGSGSPQGGSGDAPQCGSSGSPQGASSEVPSAAGGGEAQAGGALAEPLGSAYRQERRRSRRPLRRLKGFLSRVLVGIAARVLPYVYLAYCWLVWKTSRVDDRLTEVIEEGYARHDGFVAILWHQEVFTVAYAFGHLRAHTLASTGNFGQIVSRMLEICGFRVFRGGSTGAKTRKRRVLPTMIRHMQTTPRVGYGVTVDGSKGPPLKLKAGALAIAKACHAPILVARTWYSNRILLPTWDRTAIPLPFGRIQLRMIGPYWVPPTCSGEEFEALREHLELELLDMSERLYQEVDPKATRHDFPEGFTPRWAEGQWGIPHGPHDLDWDNPPPWARRPNPDRTQPALVPSAEPGVGDASS